MTSSDRSRQGQLAYRRVLALNMGLTAAVIVVIAVAIRLPASLTLRALAIHELIQFGIVTGIFSLAARRLTLSPLDRYLDAVGSMLPSDQRADLLRELRANLQARMVDVEEELGRPLTIAEQESLLARHGSPLGVAARYRGDDRRVAFGRELIGPALFPAYLGILCFNVGLVVTLLGALPVLLGKPVLQVLPIVFGQVSLQFFVVTLVFALLNRFPALLCGWRSGEPG